ncbi:MAG: lysophospholipase and related esterase [Ferruginibacter sp.]|nr:lysophospholipase and related esterase [Ferruginibacter sp.]
MDKRNVGWWKVLGMAVVITSFIACKKAPMEQGNVILDSIPTALGAKTFLALGDSYTIGQSVEEAQRFPNQAAAMLRSEGFNISAPRIIAATGWTTGNLLNALNSNPPSGTYDMVTLLIGVNNQYQGRSLSEYKTEFGQLLAMAIQYAGNNRRKVVVLSIPDYGVTPFAAGSDRARIAEEIDYFNMAAKTIASSNSVSFLDITAISREAANDQSLITYDGLHPSGKQYKRWADLLVPMLRSSF